MTQDTEIKQTKSAHKGRKLFVALLLPLLLLAALAASLVFFSLRPLTAEAGDATPPPEAFFRFSFLPFRAESDLSDASFGEIGTHDVHFSLFGIPRKTTLTVADTTPPDLHVHDHAVLGGMTVTAEDFITSASDFSAYTAELIAEGDLSAAGTHSVRIRLTDAFGNIAEKTATLTVYGKGGQVTVEALATREEAEASLREVIPEASLPDTFDASLLRTVGEQSLGVLIGNQTFTVILDVLDTTPPTATVADCYILRGAAVEPENFLTSLTDASAVTAEFVTAPDTNRAGKQEVTVRLCDAHGNETEVSATLTVYNIPSALTLEAGTPQTDALEAILGERGTGLAKKIAFSSLSVGQHEIPVRTVTGEYSVSVTMVDTTPPTATPKGVTVYLASGTRPDAADFVTDIVDKSPVTVTFDGEADLTTLGKRYISIRLTDAYGNTSTLRAPCSVVEDRMPPVITGVRDLSVYAGGRISYKSGVSAKDGDGQTLTVSVDASAVDLTVPGTYEILYTASDAYGKTARQKASVTVTEVTEDVVRPYATQVLATILTDGMTKREMARAIYDWTKANVTYVAYADKTQWCRAAYVGFTTGRGDCYVYYAMARLLLTEAGIENMEISRDNPEKPHYWNLVNCGDGWYHFDTCPHYRAYPLESFMLTDAQVAEYSKNSVKDYYSFDRSLYPETPKN